MEYGISASILQDILLLPNTIKLTVVMFKLVKLYIAVAC